MIAQWNSSLSVLSVARVTIAQWENKCISLFVLSTARLMIAQWENECVSLSVLSLARVMLAHGRMNVSHCPLHGPGHDSSVGE